MTRPHDSAFPYVNQDDPSMPADVEPGLTKREYFAGLALQGLLANSYQNPEGSALTQPASLTPTKELARYAVHAADALIAALDDAESRSAHLTDVEPENREWVEDWINTITRTLRDLGSDLTPEDIRVHVRMRVDQYQDVIAQAVTEALRREAAR